MERDASSPLSSLILSSKVFRMPYPSRGVGFDSITGSKDNIYFAPQRRVASTFRQKELGEDKQSRIIRGRSTTVPSYHTLKVNKVLSRIPGGNDSLSSLGNQGLVSEGNSDQYWSPSAPIVNQVADKLLIPTFLQMKATCGQRNSNGGLLLSTSKCGSSVSNFTDTLQIQQLQTPHSSSGSYVTELLEPVHYEYLKNGAGSRIHPVLRREKFISVTYKELYKNQTFLVNNIPHRHGNPEPASDVSGNFQYRLRQNGFNLERSPRINKKSDVENGRENVLKGTKNVLQRSKTRLSEEDSEEFVSRAATPDDEVSIRDCDSQAWDDDEIVDDEDTMSYADDAPLDTEDNDDDDDDDDVTDDDGQVSRKEIVSAQANRTKSAAPAGERRRAELLSATRKPISPAPINRIRLAQQEQQRRLHESIGNNKARPNTGPTVVYNGSLQTAARKKPVSLSKGSITRSPTATSTSNNKTGSENRRPGDLAPFHCRSSNKVGVTSEDSDVLQPLHPSLFSNIPPTLVFANEDNTVAQLPRELRSLLRWRTSTITPNILKKILSRSNFKLTAKDEVWVGCWAKHMKQDMFRSIREFQKFNHFPASFQIGRKDRLWRNLSTMQGRFGRKEFNFFPQTYILPGDYKHLKRIMDDSEKRQRWILKPPASARGNGIRCVCSMKQIPKKRPVIVQKYIHQPYLINESKFDIRLYVYVASYDPLKAYIYSDGLARFASSKYSPSLRDLPNKFMHLTNYSINKYNSEYQVFV